MSASAVKEDCDSRDVLPPSKDAQSFTVHQEHPLNAEPDVGSLIDSWKTPTDQQYLRNHGDILHIPKQGYRLHLEVEPSMRSAFDESAPLSTAVPEGSLDLDKLLAIHKVNLAAALQVSILLFDCRLPLIEPGVIPSDIIDHPCLQCAGNRREEMNERKEVEGIQWGPGTILNAEWEGKNTHR